MNFSIRYFLSYFLLLIFPLLGGAGVGLAQDKKNQPEEDYVVTNGIRYEDRVYTPNIKSILLHGTGFILAPPQIDLDGGEQLEFSFDDLDGDNKYYWYTLIHCDALWKPSDLMPQEYLTNFMEEQITNFSFSSGTMQKYTHYTWIFPSNNIKINKTGNYILKVYLDGNKDKLVLTKRFMVYSNKVTVTGNVHQ